MEVRTFTSRFQQWDWETEILQNRLNQWIYFADISGAFPVFNVVDGDVPDVHVEYVCGRSTFTINIGMLKMVADVRMICACVGHEVGHVVNDHLHNTFDLEEMRDQEYEADAYAVQFLHECGYSGHFIADFLYLLLQINGDFDDSCMDHPSYFNRISYLSEVDISTRNRYEIAD